MLTQPAGPSRRRGPAAIGVGGHRPVATVLAALLALLALLAPASHCWLPMGGRAVLAAVAQAGHDHAEHGDHEHHDAPAPAPFDRLKCPLCQGRVTAPPPSAAPAALPPRVGHKIVWRVAVPAAPGLRPLLRPSLPRAPPARA